MTERGGDLLIALDRGGPGRVGAAGVDAGEERGLGGEQDTGLTECGQHLGDVAQEGGVGPHDQHGAAVDELAVLVQEEGGPVQRDGRLPGAGTALDDQDPAVGGADDAVLLGLDGPNDVAHAAGSGGVQRREQYGVAARVLEAGALPVPEVEDLVVQLGDRTALGGDVPAAAQPHRCVSGGEIEGAGDRCAPVDQQRRAVGVVLAQSDTADMVRGAVGEIDAAEAQGAVHRVQRRQKS